MKTHPNTKSVIKTVNKKFGDYPVNIVFNTETVDITVNGFKQQIHRKARYFLLWNGGKAKYIISCLLKNKDIKSLINKTKSRFKSMIDELNDFDDLFKNLSSKIKQRNEEQNAEIYPIKNELSDIDKCIEILDKRNNSDRKRFLNEISLHENITGRKVDKRRYFKKIHGFSDTTIDYLLEGKDTPLGCYNTVDDCIEGEYTVMA